MKKVLVCATNFSANCPEAKKLLLDNGFEIVENPHQRPYTFEELSGIVGDVNAVVAGMERWSEELMQLAPDLKIISKFGVGLDTIDVPAAQARGISVANARGMNAVSVANLCIALMLGCLRKLAKFNRTIREGQWLRENANDLDGKTVGLLGFGDIGSKVAKRIGGFDVRILAYDAYPNAGLAKQLNVELTDIQTLLRESDIVSVHLPNIPQTHHFLSDEQFAMMKPGAIVINTARGPLIDEAALCRAMKSGRVAACGLDVYEQEPIGMDNPLLSMENALLTPHTAAETFESCLNVSVAAITNVVDYFNGVNPPYLATPKPFPEKP